MVGLPDCFIGIKYPLNIVKEGVRCTEESFRKERKLAKMITKMIRKPDKRSITGKQTEVPILYRQTTKPATNKTRSALSFGNQLINIHTLWKSINQSGASQLESCLPKNTNAVKSDSSF